MAGTRDPASGAASAIRLGLDAFSKESVSAKHAHESEGPLHYEKFQSQQRDLEGRADTDSTIGLAGRVTTATPFCIPRWEQGEGPFEAGRMLTETRCVFKRCPALWGLFRVADFAVMGIYLSIAEKHEVSGGVDAEESGLWCKF